MKSRAAVAPEIEMVSENMILKAETPLRRRFASVANTNPIKRIGGTVYRTNFKVTTILFLNASEANNR
jgi:hypothetical protein